MNELRFLKTGGRGGTTSIRTVYRNKHLNIKSTFNFIHELYIMIHTHTTEIKFIVNKKKNELIFFFKKNIPPIV